MEDNKENKIQTKVILTADNLEEFREQLSLMFGHVKPFNFLTLSTELSPFPKPLDLLNGEPRFQAEGEGRNRTLTESGHKKFMEITEKVAEKRELEMEKIAITKTTILSMISPSALAEITKTVGGSNILAQCSLEDMLRAMVKSMDKAKKLVANDAVQEFMLQKPEQNLTALINKSVSCGRKIKNAFEIKDKDGEGTGKMYIDALLIVSLLNSLKSPQMDFFLKSRAEYDPTKSGGMAFNTLVEDVTEYSTENSITSLTLEKLPTSDLTTTANPSALAATTHATTTSATTTSADTTRARSGPCSTIGCQKRTNRRLYPPGFFSTCPDCFKAKKGLSTTTNPNAMSAEVWARQQQINQMHQQVQAPPGSFQQHQTTYNPQPSAMSAIMSPLGDYWYNPTINSWIPISPLSPSAMNAATSHNDAVHWMPSTDFLNNSGQL